MCRNTHHPGVEERTHTEEHLQSRAVSEDMEMSFFLCTQSNFLTVIFHLLPHWGILRIIVKVGQEKKKRKKRDVAVRMAQAGKNIPSLQSKESILRRVEANGGKR